ncbi:hypothetical protein [Roseovarius aestuarii]|uniref:Uncharacterized protein n=1 Tax=Roseovarius aestuarii TaxID=475083 RepID=A0A1X7BMI2_9RHOB|nr:hypothetical protein [Roseovarius aestuarii]SMC10838.1 hypothetical protein ROA7745_00646 [Roseovarius aestuarii]
MSNIVLAALVIMAATSTSAGYICMGFDAQIGDRDSYIASEAVFRLSLRKTETGEHIVNARGKWFDGAGFEANGDWT